MGRRYAVSELPVEEQNFVIERLLDGDTDRQLAAAYSQQFAGKKLAKTSIGRWRKAAGDELAQKYKLARYQAQQLLEDLKAEDKDKFQVILENIEDRLLAATREVISRDPVKLLQIRLAEEKRRQREREIELQREKIQLEREKLKGVALDRVKLAGEFLGEVLEYIGGDAEGLKWFKKHAKKIEEFIKQKHAAQES